MDSYARFNPDDFPQSPTTLEAVDAEMARLLADNERLREALEQALEAHCLIMEGRDPRSMAARMHEWTMALEGKGNG